MNLLNLKRALRRVLVILSVFIIGPTLFPFALIFFTVCYSYRIIIYLLKSVIRRDLGLMVNARSALFTGDVFKTHPESNLVVSIVFDGNLCREKLIQDLQSTLVGAVNDSGELLLPELGQYIENFGGFSFWKDEEDFDIGQHVQYLEPQVMGAFRPIFPNEFLEIRGKLDRMGWPQGKSPWRVTIVPNYVENPCIIEQKSALFIQLNHTLSDGFSLLIVLLKKLLKSYEDSDIQNAEYSKKSTNSIIRDAILFPVKAPYQALSQVIKAIDINDIHTPKTIMSGEGSFATSPKISIGTLKGIKKLHGVSFTAILVGAITGGMRKYLKKSNYRIPQHMHVIVPFPIPESSTRKDKLRNKYSFAFLRLPTGESDPNGRLRKAERNIQFIKSSLLPILNYWGIPFLGLLPNPLINILFKNVIASGVLSNFPGPLNKCTYQGITISDILFTGGAGPGNQGFGFAIMSYNGYLRVNAFLDQNLAQSPNDVDDLLQFILEELDFLRTCPRRLQMELELQFPIK